MIKDMLTGQRAEPNSIWNAGQDLLVCLTSEYLVQPVVGLYSEHRWSLDQTPRSYDRYW